MLAVLANLVYASAIAAVVLMTTGSVAVSLVLWLIEHAADAVFR